MHIPEIVAVVQRIPLLQSLYGSMVTCIISYIYARSVCVCVCVSVHLEISGTERRVTTLLSPAEKDSPGELHKLLFKPIRCVVREEKSLELFGRLCVEGPARTLHFRLPWLG